MSWRTTRSRFFTPCFSFFSSSISLVFLITVPAMSWSAHSSLSGSRRSLTAGDTSPVWYPPPYDGTTYIPDVPSYFDTPRFSILSQADSALKTSLGSGIRNMAAGA